tara:strand:+ start:87 stop:434 length:348 start_codon:yes stop_codon:yes gene_type:complete
MNKYRFNILKEYLGASLIISYFFVHKIILVLIGITFSLYLINNNLIHKYIRSFNVALANLKTTKDLNKDSIDKESNSNQIELAKKDSSFTLVERIEEFGFIPSLDESDNKIMNNK